MFTSENPNTGERLETFAAFTRAETERRLSHADSAYRTWSSTSLDARVAVVERIGDLLEAERERHAAVMTNEMGKPISQARAEVDKCVWLCRHYASNGPGYLAPQVVETEAHHSAVRHDPLGPILAIMPWNFPYWQVLRVAVPALLAGNVLFLKHAENVTRTALELESLVAAAGAVEGALQVLLVARDDVAGLIADRRIRAVTLTGSVAAGRSVAEQAGRNGKKSVLELGSSDPFIVLDDADVGRAAEVGLASRLLNSGQTCISAKRFIVSSSIAADFEEALRAGLGAVHTGDPMDEATDVGPLARPDLAQNLHGQVQASVASGATLAVGGHALEGPGNHYAPTLVLDVVPGHVVAEEETFGPVAAVMRVGSDDEAVALANATRYGLGAAVWTADLERARSMVPRLDVGLVAVNDLVRSDPRLPFGGVKDSGYGRELGEAGAREFTNTKAVWIQQ